MFPDIFASFYSRFKRLRIYDPSAILLHDIDIRIDSYITNFEDETEGQFVYYVDRPFATSEYIYALCLNVKDRDTNPSEGTFELHVWSWEGIPLVCYKLDRTASLIGKSTPH